MKLLTSYQSDYSGGLNDTDSAIEIADNEASLLRNWDITNQGELNRRNGLTKIGNTIGSNPITGLGAYIRDGGKDLLAMEDTNLYYLNSATWTKLDSGFTNTSGLQFWIENIQVLGKVFISNEDNVMHSWDRAATTLNSCLTEEAATDPHGNVLKWHKNHLFHLNNVNVNGTKYPNRLYWSSIGDPLTYDTTNDFANVPGDGRLITAVDLGDSLVLFKERAIQLLSGWGNTSWRISATASNYANLDQQIGCPALRGACRVDNEVWFIDNHGQIRRIYQTDTDAVRHEVVSRKIQGTLAGINKTQIAKSVLWYNNNKVYCAVPNGSDTSNSLILVFDVIAAKRTGQEAWTTYTGWTPGIFADYPTSATAEFYQSHATTGKIYKNTGTDDDGVAIDARYDGKDDNGKRPEQLKHYRIGHIRGVAGSGNQEDIDIYASIGGSPFTRLSVMQLMTQGSRLGPTGTFRLGPTGTATLAGSSQVEHEYFFGAGVIPLGTRLRMSLRHNAVSEQPTVGTYSNHYKPKQLR